MNAYDVRDCSVWVDGRFLPGISRQTVIDLSTASGIDVIERKITPDEIQNFDKCFITGTAAEVTPVTELCGTEHKVGAITEFHIELYSKTINSNQSTFLPATLPATISQ